MSHAANSPTAVHPPREPGAGKEKRLTPARPPALWRAAENKRLVYDPWPTLQPVCATCRHQGPAHRVGPHVLLVPNLPSLAPAMAQARPRPPLRTPPLLSERQRGTSSNSVLAFQHEFRNVSTFIQTSNFPLICRLNHRTVLISIKTDPRIHAPS